MSNETQLDARVLGQLLLMQSMVIGLPDETIFDFVCRGLSELPGVAKALYVQDGAVAPDADPGRRQCALRIPGRPPRGLIELEITDPSALDLYLGYLDNFCATLTLILEERDQRHRIEEQQQVLEQRVAERTQALVQSETRYRTLANDLPVLVCDNLPDGTLTYVNVPTATTSASPARR